MLNIRPIYPTSWRIETRITVQARLRVGECLVFRPKLLSCQIVFFRNLHKLYLAAQNMWNILKVFVLNLKLCCSKNSQYCFQIQNSFELGLIQFQNPTATIGRALTEFRISEDVNSRFEMSGERIKNTDTCKIRYNLMTTP